MGLWNKIVTESDFWKQSVREGMILQSSLNLLLLTRGTPLSEKRGKYKFWRGNERSEQFQLHAHNLLKHYLCIGIDPQVGAYALSYLLCWYFLMPILEQGLQPGCFLDLFSHYQELDSSEQCSQKYNLHVCTRGMKLKEIQEYRMLSSG